ncbi:MAG: FAD-binding oxidoreductase [Hymenobacteraceae bacterium]|nr:FAD-binding oxidoreductase [Hymenobacteraceae bacterium]
MELSYWEKETWFSGVDVLIVGSGIVGLNAALHLKTKQPNLKVVVAERGLLPTGASTRNAGFACFGSPSELLDDLTHHSESDVFTLVERRWRGLQRLRQNLGDQAIDFHRWGGYELFQESQSELYEACLEQLPYLNRQLKQITSEQEVFRLADHKIADFGFRHVPHLIESTAEGQIDTGKMILALTQKVQAMGVLLLNGLEIESLQEENQGITALTKQGIAVPARAALVATNGFARQLLPQIKVVPARAQVLITKPIPDLRIKGTFHYDQGFYYFRNIGNRVLFGGGRNLDFKAEETTELGLTELVQHKLDELLREVILPDTSYEVEQRWSGIMGVGPEKTTIVKSVSEHVCCAVRMGGMGVAIGSLVGEEGADLVLEKI